MFDKLVSENPVLDEIQRLSNKKFSLYLELDHVIQSGGLHLGDAQSQTIEIRKINEQLVRLWVEERARGKYWIPRLGTNKYSEKPSRPKGAHGYRIR